MLKPGKETLIYSLLLLAALSFRLGIAVFLPNDDSEHGKVYAQIATNLLDQRVYSQANEPPYSPTMARTPGYPVFIAAIYGAFGDGNNTAVRIVQALLDTATCGLIALVAFWWEPDTTRKRAASIGALVLAAICPFTMIYVGTILTETLTTFLMALMCLTATLAFEAQSVKRRSGFWAITGVLTGLAVLFRPDSALFAAAIGLTLLITTVFRRRTKTNETAEEERPSLEHNTGRPPPSVVQTLSSAALLTLGFCLVLVPWTIRNWRVFHVVQPLATRYAEMTGEFVPYGYLRWARTWVDDEREVAPFIWALDTLPIDIEEMPAKAFDSDEEKQRIATLLKQYNGAQPAPVTEQETPDDLGFQLVPSPGPSPSQQKTPDTVNDEVLESEEEESKDEAGSSEQNVAMTPEIDAGFAQLANERIARSPFRYYIKLPVKRAIELWFNTHSQYYPFEGELFLQEDEEHTSSQKVFLPLFASLTWIYTFLGLGGAWFLWESGPGAGRRWLLPASLIIVLRLGFFSFLENPEPRYVVELFPLVAILGGIALVRVVESFLTPQKTTI